MKDVMGKNLKGDLLEDDAMIEEFLPLYNSYFYFIFLFQLF